MNLRITLPLCAALLAGLAACDSGEKAGAGDAAARAVLEKAVACMGGDATLADVKSMRIEARGTWQGLNLPPAPYTTEVFIELPDRYSWRLDAGMMRGAMGVDGDTAWTSWMGPPARVKGAMKQHLAQALRAFEIVLVSPLLHRDDLKISGSGRTVTVGFPDGLEYVLTFGEGDACFLTAMEGDMTHWDGRKGKLEMKLSKPTKFGDVTLPAVSHVQTFLEDGSLVETVQEETTAIEWNPEIEDARFAVPELDTELMKVTEKSTSQMQGVMLVHEGSYDSIGETIKKLHKVSEEAGLMMMGPIHAVFLNNPQDVADPAELRTEVILPVMLMGPPVEDLPEGAVLKPITAEQVASMTTRGPYGKADVEAIGKTMAWIQENGYEVTGSPRCIYFHDPESTVAEDLVSEVQIPIRKKE